MVNDFVQRHGDHILCVGIVFFRKFDDNNGFFLFSLLSRGDLKRIVIAG